MASEVGIDPLGKHSIPHGGTSNKLYSLRWNSFQTHFPQTLMKVLLEEEFTDIILAAEGKYIKAHKLILSMCSPYLKQLIKANTPPELRTGTTIIILNNIKFADLERIIEFIYCGEAKVAESDLKTFLQAGELLEIEGLSKKSDTTSPSAENETKTGKSLSQNIHPAPGPTRPPIQCNSSLLRTFPTKNSDNPEQKMLAQHGLKDCDVLEVEDSSSDILLSEVDEDEDFDYLEENEDHSIENGEEFNNHSNALYTDDSDGEDDNDDMNVEEPEDETSLISPIRNSPPKWLEASKIDLVNKPQLKRSNVKVDMTKFRPCPYCQQMFYKSNLSRHVSQAHTQDLLRQGKKLFQCDDCRYIYRTDYALKMHRKKQHPNGA